MTALLLLTSLFYYNLSQYSVVSHLACITLVVAYNFMLNAYAAPCPCPSMLSDPCW